MTNPLAEILESNGWSNHDVVEAAEGQLSHKNVQKARTGSRPVTDGVARNLTAAIRNLLAHRQVEGETAGAEPVRYPTVRELFPGYPRGRSRRPFVPGEAQETEAEETTED